MCCACALPLSYANAWNFKNKLESFHFRGLVVFFSFLLSVCPSFLLGVTYAKASTLPLSYIPSTPKIKRISFLFEIYFFLYGHFCLYICLNSAYVSARKPQDGVRSFSWLWATCQCYKANPGSLEEQALLFNLRAISPAPLSGVALSRDTCT